jgi:putative endonuclease
MSPQRRSRGECRSAQREGQPLRAKGRPAGDPRSTRDAPPPARPQPSTSGLDAERLGAAFLEARGLSIVERNYRRRCGEIDLVARDGPTVVFVEVRLRRGASFGGAAASITAAKRRRLIQAASLYLAGMDATPCCRFDALLLDALDPARIEWLQDVIST